MYHTGSASLVEPRIANQALTLVEEYRINPIFAVGGMVFLCTAKLLIKLKRKTK